MRTAPCAPNVRPNSNSSGLYGWASAAANSDARGEPIQNFVRPTPRPYPQPYLIQIHGLQILAKAQPRGYHFDPIGVCDLNSRCIWLEDE